MVRIDMHLHTTRYSKCSRLSTERLIEISGDVRVHAIVITEHDVLWPGDELAELQQQVKGDLRLFRAVEVTTDIGDILTYNLSDSREITKGMPFETLAEYAREDGAALVLAHPGRYIQSVPEDRSSAWDQIAAVEVMSNNIMESMIPNVNQAVTTLRKPCVASSDAHDDEIVGLYATVFPRMPLDEAELARMIIDAVVSPWADERRVEEMRRKRPDRPILLENPVEQQRR
jgi:predicted metal-dependent phosphoesterase TrpH